MSILFTQSGDGHVSVYSEPGHGTTFSVYFPQVDEFTSEEGSGPEITIQKPQEAITILLVEDEEMVRDLASRTLNWHGYNVLEAENGEEALELAKQNEVPIHLLLTDVVMPGGVSGGQLAENMMLLYPGIRVIFMSGYTDDTIVRHGVLTSGKVFLQKPFTPKVLLNKVREVL
jgi:CheY-like chemotaxis protein